jgi:hypothetical protein
MANIPVLPQTPTAAVAPMGQFPPANPFHFPFLPVLPPAENGATGGPTTGQLFPVGNR